ncbi:MAG: STAS domain-containing protein [Candidatus Omnitrophica bacterium]|nr:STAS domain-containing protein [Candidatus Omnitrophota bacterium]
MMNIFRFNKAEKFPPMVKAIEQYETFSVVKLAGGFDFYNMPSIEKVIREHKGHGHFDQDVVLDFKEVTHIDTSTLAVLIYIMNTLKQRHRKLCLINCNKLIRDYIKVNRLQSVIHVYKTLKDVPCKTK